MLSSVTGGTTEDILLHTAHIYGVFLIKKYTYTLLDFILKKLLFNSYTS